MDKNFIRSYRSINSELDSIRNSIEELQKTSETFAFEKGKIDGMATIIPQRVSAYLVNTSVRRKLTELIFQLQMKERLLVVSRERIESYIETIGDETTRIILRDLYLNGKNQNEIAMSLSCSRSAVAQKVKRHWDKEEKDKDKAKKREKSTIKSAH